ncbi:MAG: hypothetical protein JSR83_10135 [Proteobacteria bacterium]|nr:hypothetical protein [Pseudomonadota bacterium]
MAEQIEVGSALKVLNEHQAKAQELRERLEHVSGAAATWRESLADYQRATPDLAALEKAESDALAAVALGEVEQETADRASSLLAEGRRLAGELGPKIKTAHSTIAGLERKGEEIRATLAQFETARASKLKAFLVEEMEAEAARYVTAAAALIRHHSRIRALGRLAQKAGLATQLTGADLKLVIGRMESLKAFAGQQSNPHKSFLMFEGGITGQDQTKSQAAERDERQRLTAELGIEFESELQPAGEGV